MAFLYTACHSAKERQPKFDTVVNQGIYDSASTLLAHGDLVLRLGRDDVSKMFARLNVRNTQYAHCGVAIQTPKGFYVYHVIGGADNPEGTVLAEPLSSFVAARNIEQWAIVRYHFTPSQKAMFIQTILDDYHQKISFDKDFDLATDQAMYCSEMIYKAMIKATADTGLIQQTHTHNGKPYIAVDNLFEHKHCQTICEVVYK